MRYTFTGAALLALMLAPAVHMAGQDTGKSVDLSGVLALLDQEPRRVWFGFILNEDTRDTDTLGAYVEAVTPGGPAHTAGVRSGAIITKVAGQSLAATGKGDQRTLPKTYLVALASRLTPNEPVPLEMITREGKRKTIEEARAAADVRGGFQAVEIAAGWSCGSVF